MKKTLFAVMMIACLAVSFAYAEQPALMEGGWELGVEGAFDFEDMHGTSLDAEVSLGYFIMDNVEIGGIVGFEYAEGDPDDVTNVLVGAFGEYNFDLESNWVPYVGAELGYLLVDSGVIDENVFQVEGSVGVKYFMTENWAIDGSVNFVWASEDVFYNDGNVEDTDIGATVGIRTYF